MSSKIIDSAKLKDPVAKASKPIRALIISTTALTPNRPDAAVNASLLACQHVALPSVKRIAFHDNTQPFAMAEPAPANEYFGRAHDTPLLSKAAVGSAQLQHV